MQPVEIPVIKRLLAAAACHQCIPGCCFANQSLRLAGLYSFIQKRLAERLDIQLSICDSGPQRLGTPPGRMGFFDAGQTVGQLATLRAGMDEFPPTLVPLSDRRQGALQMHEFADGGLKSQPALLLLDLKNAQ